MEYAMKIDTTLFPHTFGPLTLPGRTGEGLSFDTFYSPSSEDERAGVKAAPVLSQNVFGFDALGVLGLGGPAGFGRRLVALPEGRTAGTFVSGAASRQDIRAAPEVGTQAADIYGPVPVAAAPAGTRPEPGPSIRPLSPHPEVMPVGGFAAPPAPIPAVQPVAVESLSRTGGVIFSAFRPMTAETAQDMPMPRKAAAAFRATPEADPAPGQISVTASEDGERLHIAAAAPDLTDNDRQNLKTLAEEAAAEAGVTLGDLRLNGVVVRQFSKTR
jgi:hypothetical protein